MEYLGHPLVIYKRVIIIKASMVFRSEAATRDIEQLT
jgi:hypothetical protein